MTRLELFRIKSMWGNYAFDYACSMARGLSGGLISIWDPLCFSQKFIWFVTLVYSLSQGNWKNVGIVDLPIGGRSFTWMNKAGTKLSKLDRFLISEDVTIRLLDVRITASRLHTQHQEVGRNRKTVALEEINSIEKRIDEGSAMPSDNDHRLILLQEIEKIDKFASMDIIQKAHVKWDIEGVKIPNSSMGSSTKNGDQMIIWDFWLCSLTFLILIPLIAWIEKTMKNQVTLEEIKEARLGLWDSSKAPGSKEQSAFIAGRQILDVGLFILCRNQLSVLDLVINGALDLKVFVLKFFRELLFLVMVALHLSFTLSVVFSQGDPLSPFLYLLWKVSINAFEEQWECEVTFLPQNALWVQVIKALIMVKKEEVSIQMVVAQGHLVANIGCGTRIRFWKDIWVGETLLFTRYNRLYHLDQDKDCLIIDRINMGNGLNKISFPLLLIYYLGIKSYPPEGLMCFCGRLSLGSRLPHRLNLSSRGMDIRPSLVLLAMPMLNLLIMFSSNATLLPICGSSFLDGVIFLFFKLLLGILSMNVDHLLACF
ncbi:hypothetical protein Tco_0178771 [Tanacetum coccineum]